MTVLKSADCTQSGVQFAKRLHRAAHTCRMHSALRRMKEFHHPCQKDQAPMAFSHANGGFALVVAVLMLVMLTLVAVAMLGLSSVVLRSSSAEQASAMAKANARMALALAISELQLSMGADQRVSAPAAAVSSQAQQPHLTGVWESWRWQPNQASPSYSQKSGQFLRWLVSANPSEATSIDFPNRQPSGETIDLVSDQRDSQGISTRVQARKILVNGNDPKARGAYAWAVFDESTKAPIDLANPTSPPQPAQEHASRTAPHRVRADVLDTNQLSHLRNPRNLVSLETATIPAQPNARNEIRRRFHDLTTHTLGLLTDTAAGGLKQDLSTLLSSQTFDPQVVDGAQSLYDTIASGAPRWSFLHDHYQKFRDPQLTFQQGSPTYRQTTAQLNPNNLGRDNAPIAANLLPSIAKLQVVFSLVTHPETNGNRLSRAPSAERSRYANPMLVYEAIITLHNPYDVAIQYDQLRFRVWNPPVGFRIGKKTGANVAWLRQEWQSDPNNFHGLGRFNRLGQNDVANMNQRFFTVHLSDGQSSAAGSRLLLQPGEVKVFAPRVELDWRWGWEWGQKPRRPWQFLDWFNSDDTFGAGNRDLRSNNEWGVEAVPGWDLRAGLQMNHLSMEGGVNGGRPSASYYPFEDQMDYWAADPMIHFDDALVVELRPQKTTAASILDAFRVDLLAAKNPDSSDILNSQDLLRSFRFRFTNPTQEISGNPNQPVIRREFICGQLFQSMDDPSAGGKTPFALLEMSARTTNDALDDSKAWAFNNPVVEGGEIHTNLVGLANQSYDLRLREIASITEAPMVEWDAADGEGSPGFGRGYFGAGSTSNLGVTNVPMYRVPIAPAASLGDWIPTNLITSSQLPRVVHAFGNSRAHPLIPAESVINQNLAGRLGLDHSYFLNDALWDRYYFSSVTDIPALPWLSNQARTRREVLQDLLEQRANALNPRITALKPTSQASAVVQQIQSLNPKVASRELSRHLGVRGPFNLNSTSVDAWRAVLSSLRDQAITGWRATQLTHQDQTPLARLGMPLAGPNQSSQDLNLIGQIRWAGFRALDDGEIERLAREIVNQIRERGKLDQAPPLTLAEFVNRRVAPASELHSLQGLLQTAIDRSGINDATHAIDSRPISAATFAGNLAPRVRGAANPDAMYGFTGEGSPGVVTQGDLMMALAPIATVRGDTFKIRAYGESRSADGRTILARAWCEAVVQRMPDFVDPSDAPATEITNLQSSANQRFGRKFHQVSFRWLNSREL